MPEKMQVIYVKHTGHVLAAFTRSADPEGKSKVGDLIGKELLLRTKGVQLPNDIATPVNTLPLPLKVIDLSTSTEPKELDALEVELVTYNPNAIHWPLGFGVIGDKVSSLSSPSSTSPTLTANQLTIPCKNDGKVFACLQKLNDPPGEEQPSYSFQGKTPESAVAATSVILNLPLNIASGKYLVLALATGLRPFFAELTVT